MLYIVYSFYQRESWKIKSCTLLKLLVVNTEQAVTGVNNFTMKLTLTFMRCLHQLTMTGLQISSYIICFLRVHFTRFLLTKMVRLLSQLQKQTAFTCMFHTQLAPLNIQKTDCKQESSGDGEGMLVIQWTTHNKTGV